LVGIGKHRHTAQHPKKETGRTREHTTTRTKEETGKMTYISTTPITQNYHDNRKI